MVPEHKQTHWGNGTDRRRPDPTFEKGALTEEISRFQLVHDSFVASFEDRNFGLTVGDDEEFSAALALTDHDLASGRVAYPGCPGQPFDGRPRHGFKEVQGAKQQQAVVHPDGEDGSLRNLWCFGDDRPHAPQLAQVENAKWDRDDPNQDCSDYLRQKSWRRPQRRNDRHQAFTPEKEGNEDS
jgi:hypothetical protein